jgi:hypothetical protein
VRREGLVILISYLLLPQIRHSPQSLFYSVVVAMFRPPWLVALLALLADFALADHPENGVDKYLTVRRASEDIAVVFLLTRGIIET